MHIIIFYKIRLIWGLYFLKIFKIQFIPDQFLDW